MENFETSNKHGSVFLTNLYVPEDNKLLLEVKNSTTSDFEVNVQIGDKYLSGCKEITIDGTGTFFTILFNDYVSIHCNK